MSVVFRAENLRPYRGRDNTELLCMGIRFILWLISSRHCCLVCPGACIAPIAVMLECLLCSGAAVRRWQSRIAPALS